MKEVILGGMPFTKKKDIIGYAQSIKTSPGTVYPVGSTEYNFLYELLARGHLNAKAKIGMGIREFVVEADHAGITRFTIVRPGGDVMDFSYLKCVRYLDYYNLADAKKNDRWQKLQAACRYAVLDQINSYRRRTNPHICALCGRSGDHVDHDDPQFIRIVLDFNKTRDDVPVSFADVGPEEMDCRKPKQYFRDQDRRYRMAFEKYHQERAVLRLLCGPCNLRRNKERNCHGAP